VFYAKDDFKDFKTFFKIRKRVLCKVKFSIDLGPSCPLVINNNQKIIVYREMEFYILPPFDQPINPLTASCIGIIKWKNIPPCKIVVIKFAQLCIKIQSNSIFGKYKI